MLGLGLEVMFTNRDMELDFLKLGLVGFGILALLPFGFLLLITIFPVVDDFANRGIGGWSDAEEVEFVTFCDFVSLTGAHATEVLAIWSDEDDFRVANVFIDGVDCLIWTAAVKFVCVSDCVFLLGLSIKNPDSIRFRPTKTVVSPFSFLPTP